MSPEERLWSAVILQAVVDYKAALKTLSVTDSSKAYKNAKAVLSKIEREFNSSWAEEFCGYLNISSHHILNKLLSLKKESELVKIH